ncbi:hypothetical protein [Caballeronia novacaledonica]|uniref:Glycosyltransferase RgtA/B/C/D-like domain-containing protein n=1 Tax=Caballeronia novacaledonica TaxID=1544861 RepID=A0AA37IAY4_9BURK|nr:hypothetical protein [Caballeronia novacaledonica]GJH26018.1 hypothetical protein CBA19CS42_15900 [Caballeronia novacaledonica]
MKRCVIIEYRTVPCFLAALLAALAIALHAPGQLSYDSVTQLYEASIGRSVSWNPPFMSAMLAWLGGGTVASSVFVALNACATYGAFVIVIRSAPAISATRALFCSIVLTNPVVFAYVGIVWKDVLFASWAVLTFATCLAAQRTQSTSVRFALVALAAIFLGVGALIRQQGVFMAPIFLLAPLGIVWSTWRRARRIQLIVVSALLFVVAWAVTGQLVNRTIGGNDGRAMAAAPAIVQTFDIAGMVVRMSTPDAMATFPGLTADDDKQIRERYVPDRVDFLAIPTLKPDLLRAAGGQSLTPVWLNGIKTHPMAYVRHRVSSIMSLLDLRDINKCLPIQVGVEGAAEYLEHLNLRAESSARARFLYSKLRTMFAYPVWRNWLYVAIMAIVTGILLFKRNGVAGPTRLVVWVYLLAMWVFLASFLPTTIACDFRYLYPIIPLITAILLTLFSRSGDRYDKAPLAAESARV